MLKAYLSVAVGGVDVSYRHPEGVALQDGAVDAAWLKDGSVQVAQHRDKHDGGGRPRGGATVLRQHADLQRHMPPLNTAAIT